MEMLYALELGRMLQYIALFLNVNVLSPTVWFHLGNALFVLPFLFK